jgi:hypothetical protein
MPLHTPGGYVVASSQLRIGAKIMTDKHGFADKVRDHATADARHAHLAPDHRRWTGVMKYHSATLGESA